MSAGLPSESSVALSIMSIILNLPHILSLDQEAQIFARTYVDNHCRNIGEATVPPWPGDITKYKIKQGFHELLDEWLDNEIVQPPSHATNERSFDLSVKHLDTHIIRKLYQPELIEVDVFEIKASRRGPSATHRWLPSLVPRAKLYEMDIQDLARNERSPSTNEHVDQAVEWLLHSIHGGRIKNPERPVLFITHGECSNLLKQVLFSSKNEIQRTSPSPWCELLFSRTLDIIESDWVVEDNFAMISKDESCPTIQQARFLTPQQLICFETKWHESKSIEAAARVCIEGFTLLYILTRLWSHLNLTTPTITPNLPPFFPYDISTPVPSDGVVYLSILWSCWTLAFHRLHSADRYQDHCLFTSFLTSSVIGFFGAHDPWDFFTRYLFWGVIVGLVVSAFVHRWVRRA